MVQEEDETELVDSDPNYQTVVVSLGGDFEGEYVVFVVHVAAVVRTVAVLAAEAAYKAAETLVELEFPVEEHMAEGKLQGAGVGKGCTEEGEQVVRPAGGVGVVGCIGAAAAVETVVARLSFVDHRTRS